MFPFEHKTTGAIYSKWEGKQKLEERLFRLPSFDGCPELENILLRVHPESLGNERILSLVASQSERAAHLLEVCTASYFKSGPYSRNVFAFMLDSRYLH
jgi:hypothetical protein